jgi:hypothetical protein
MQPEKIVTAISELIFGKKQQDRSHMLERRAAIAAGTGHW